jgi:hypothetical protein
MRPEDIARMSVGELRARFVEKGRTLPLDCEEALRSDPRAGARAVFDAIRKRRRENRSEGQRLRHLLRHETALWERGLTRIAGVDEAGMAPLAGPVVAAAVILQPDFRARGIDDSKQIDAAERERLAVEIKAAAICWAVGVTTVEEIDAINIYRAGLLAMRRAVEGLATAPEHILIDARRLPEVKIPQQGIIHGDARRDDGAVRPGVPGLRVRATQGLPDRGALRDLAGARRLPAASPQLRAHPAGTRARAGSAGPVRAARGCGGGWTVNAGAVVLLAFGLISSLLLIAVGIHRAVTRRYRDRSGVVREGIAAVKAGLLVALIGAGELAITAVLYAAAR